MTNVVPVLFLLVAAVIVLPSARCQGYPTQFDNINVDAILDNRRLMNSYIKCFLGDDDSGCNQMGKMARAVFSEVMTTNCAKCSTKQKAILQKVVAKLLKTRPTLWRQIEAKYDPERVFAKNNPQFM